MTTTNRVGPTGAGELETTTAPQPQFIGGLDTATMVMAIRASSRQERIQSGESEARAAETDRKAQVEARLEAMRKAAEAREEGGFWSEIAGVAKTVACVAAVVVGVAASVYTAGTSGLLAAAAVAALTAAPAVLPELAEKLADATGADGWARVAILGTAAAVCIALAIWNPAGAISGTTQAAAAASETTQTIAQAARTVEGMARIVSAESQIYQGLSLVEGGLCTVREGDFQAAATEHRAFATAAGSRRDEAMEQLQAVCNEAVRDARTFARMLDNQDMGGQAALRA